MSFQGCLCVCGDGCLCVCVFVCKVCVWLCARCVVVCVQGVSLCVVVQSNTLSVKVKRFKPARVHGVRNCNPLLRYPECFVVCFASAGTDSRDSQCPCQLSGETPAKGIVEKDHSWVLRHGRTGEKKLRGMVDGQTKKQSNGTKSQPFASMITTSRRRSWTHSENYLMYVLKLS